MHPGWMKTLPYLADWGVDEQERRQGPGLTPTRLAGELSCRQARMGEGTVRPGQPSRRLPGAEDERTQARHGSTDATQVMGRLPWSVPALNARVRCGFAYVTSREPGCPRSSSSNPPAAQNAMALQFLAQPPGWSLSARLLTSAAGHSESRGSWRLAVGFPDGLNVPSVSAASGSSFTCRLLGLAGFLPLIDARGYSYFGLAARQSPEIRAAGSSKPSPLAEAKDVGSGGTDLLARLHVA